MTTAAPQEIFEQYGVAYWDVAGIRTEFSVRRVSEDFSRRAPRHKRMLRDGVRHDDMGSDGRVWKVQAVFFNDSEEPGIPSESYPDLANKICDSFDRREVGELYLPTRGPKRCKPMSYQRVEEYSMRDFCVIEFVWEETNEDDQTASSFQAPSASSVANKQAEQLSGEADLEGWSGGNGFADVAELASGLESLATAPGDSLASLESQGKSLSKSIDVALGPFTNGNESPAPDVFDKAGPDQHQALARAAKLQDAAERAKSDALSDQPQSYIVTYQIDVSLMRVAADTKNPLAQLLKANAGLNPLSIPSGTPIRVFELS